MKNVVVRGLDGEDVTALARLWHDSWASTGLAGADSPSLEQYEDRLSTEGRTMWSIQVAAVGNDLLGFVAYQREPGWLRQLFVKPAMKRLGLGTLLLDSAKRGMPGGFWLRTNADNSVARRFYEAQGLRFDGEVVHPTLGHRMAHYLWSSRQQPRLADRTR